LPDGRDSYTRAGNFSINADGQIVTAEGYVVSPGISVPTDATSVSINRQGIVSAIPADGSTPQDIGALELARFVNPPGLDAIGDNLFLETAASGAANRGQPGAIGFGTLQQGYLETSNVNAVTEISDLITAQRAYEMNSKVITTTDQMLQTMTQLR
jgi:flagellar basal-body rod protein FlgG